MKKDIFTCIHFRGFIINYMFVDIHFMFGWQCVCICYFLNLFSLYTYCCERLRYAHLAKTVHRELLYVCGINYEWREVQMQPQNSSIDTPWQARACPGYCDPCLLKHVSG